jgi:hypothetical protein
VEAETSMPWKVAMVTKIIGTRFGNEESDWDPIHADSIAIVRMRMRSEKGLFLSSMCEIGGWVESWNPNFSENAKKKNEIAFSIFYFPPL